MYGTYCRLRVRTWDSNISVIRAARSKLTKSARRDPAQRDARKKFFRLMLDYHRQAQTTMREFRL